MPPLPSQHACQLNWVCLDTPMWAKIVITHYYLTTFVHACHTNWPTLPSPITTPSLLHAPGHTNLTTITIAQYYFCTQSATPIWPPNHHLKLLNNSCVHAWPQQCDHHHHHPILLHYFYARLITSEWPPPLFGIIQQLTFVHLATPMWPPQSLI